MQIVKSLAYNILILSFVVATFNGVVLEQGVFSIVVAGALFGLALALVDPILGFFQFPKNFWAYLIVGTIINFVFYFLLNSLVVGFLDFQPGYLGGDFGPIEFPQINLDTETLSVIFTAVYSSLLTFLYKELDKA